MSVALPATHEHADHHSHAAHADIGFLRKYIFSIDHKIIGIQFLFLGLMFMVVGGLLAMLIRWQLAWPDDQTQGRDHPVPILAKSMWAKVDAATTLGKITAVDLANKTVTVGNIANSDIRADDAVMIKAASGDLPAQVLSVVDGQATIGLQSADASIKAGAEVLGKRVPGSMPPDFYNMVVSMHATIMIFFVLIPLLVGTFGNYLIPLKIGTADMAFPFMNGFVFWSALAAGVIMVAGFFMPGGAAAAGWTSYPPLSAIHQAPKPWGVGGSWYEYKRAHTPIEQMGEKLRIGGEMVQLENVKTDGKTLTASFAAETPAALVEKATGAGRAALAEYKKSHPQVNLAGIVIQAKTDPKEVATFSIKGADADVANALLAATQDKLSWQGTWSDASLVGAFIVMSMMFGFICAYHVKLGNGLLNVLMGLAISMSLGFLMLKGVQYAAFDGQSAWFLSITLLGFSSIMGAVNYLTTIIKLRCPGMTMFRLPLSVWALFITSLLVLMATPVLASALTLNLLDHHRLTSFFLPLNWTLSNQIQTLGGHIGEASSTLAGGGYPLLHEHLFWFYSHPAVYIMIVPAMGMVSDILAVFSRKPIFGYRPMVYAMAGIAFLGFVVWAHHMFQSGMNPALGTGFAISTMFIAVPSAIKVFNWLGTLWRGNIQFTTPMLNALAFVSMFVIGGLSGIFMASTMVDVQIHGTMFIVAHIHYVLFGGSMFGIFAAIYFWYPKMFGRMMNETVGKIHFWLSFISFNCAFFTMHILGLRTVSRRVHNYTNYNSFSDLQPMNEFITISAFVMGASQVFFIINFIGSWVWGKKAPSNPWNATTLEWADAPSPPPHNNFAKTPQVYHGPYEYSSPLVEEDWLAQTRYVEGLEMVASKGH